MPTRPAARMKPGVAGGLGSERQQRVVALLGRTTAKAAVRRRAHRVAVEPLGDAAREGARLGLIARETAFELADASSFVEEDLPVLGRPSVRTRPQQRHDAGLVT